jgi:N-acetylglucosaminyldiphosphoundecaprenol N-acetyl-beta-D-mannosaminyltransferase
VRDTFRILRSRVDRLTFPQTLERIRDLVASGAPHQVITVNTLMLLAAENDAELMRLIENASLAVPESWGISWASRRLGQPLDHYIPGIDLLLALCRICAQEGQRIFLLGGRPGIAQKAADALIEQFPGLRIAGTQHGYFTLAEEPQVLSAIKQARPAFLFVGMSVPSQEKWIQRHRVELKVPVSMGVGGSFDVLSGQLKRAPLWMRRMGIEWVYRTLQEPWRLKRIKGLPVFMWHVWRKKP